MDVGAWCSQSRVWVVAGKGGVGKTTITSALATSAASAGLSVLVVELEGKHGLGATFGRAGPVDYEPVALTGPPIEEGTRGGGPAPGSVWARRLTPDDALLEYLADHGLHRVSKRLVSSGVLDVVATAIPGIRDVLVLGKVKQIERAGLADMVILDAPATGHAMTFLTSASGLLDAARGGPIRTQAADVVELLQDPARCRVLPVTLPEEMPVSETVEAAFQLEDRVGIHLGPVVVNCYESGDEALGESVDDAARESGSAVSDQARAALEAARLFRLHRIHLVEEQVGRLAQDLPLPQLRVPRLFTPSIGPAERSHLAAALASEIAGLPDAVRTT
jgi:anion-transporting  ArsA/GET3 family ATPase